MTAGGYIIRLQIRRATNCGAHTDAQAVMVNALEIETTVLDRFDGGGRRELDVPIHPVHLLAREPGQNRVEVALRRDARPEPRRLEEGDASSRRAAFHDFRAEGLAVHAAWRNDTDSCDDRSAHAGTSDGDVAPFTLRPSLRLSFRIDVSELGSWREWTEMEHDERLRVGAIHEAVSDIWRYEDALASIHLVLDAIQTRDHLPTRDVDELLGVRMVMLVDLVTWSDLRDAHEAGSGANGLGSEQDTNLASPPRIGRPVLNSSDSGARCFHLSSA